MFARATAVTLTLTLTLARTRTRAPSTPTPEKVLGMRAAVPEALSIGLPGGDPAACLARLRHHWALDTWRSSP